MALKVKANEKLQKIGKYADTYRYVMQPELYTALSQDKVIREAALRSGVSQGVMKACWDAAGQVIRAWATEGQNGTSEDEGGSTNSGNNISTPVISGTTPFEESTEVSMTGPDGAEIRYTTDGSTPTAESTLYESAFTLSNTATVKAIAIKEGESSQVATKYFAKGTSGSGGAGGQD